MSLRDADGADLGPYLDLFCYESCRVLDLGHRNEQSMGFALEWMPTGVTAQWQT